MSDKAPPPKKKKNYRKNIQEEIRYCRIFTDHHCREHEHVTVRPRLRKHRLRQSGTGKDADDQIYKRENQGRSITVILLNVRNSRGWNTDPPA